MSKPKPLRLFLDSNVLTGGIIAAWGLDKAILSLCASRICQLVLAEKESEFSHGGWSCWVSQGETARTTLVNDSGIPRSIAAAVPSESAERNSFPWSISGQR